MHVTVDFTDRKIIDHATNRKRERRLNGGRYAVSLSAGTICPLTKKIRQLIV